jgi:hypothetical protein
MNQVRATLSLLEMALDSDTNFQRFVLISGQDVPLVTNDAIHAWFSKHGSIDFIESQPVLGDKLLERRVSHFHSSFPSRLSKAQKVLGWPVYVAFALPQRLLGTSRKMNYLFFKGSQWWDLTRGAVIEIVRLVQMDSNVVRRFRFTLAADELFFQTALSQCGFSLSAFVAPSRFIDWESGPEHPRTLRFEDLDRVLESNSLFARKVDENVDPILVEALYKRISNPS